MSAPEHKVAHRANQERRARSRWHSWPLAPITLSPAWASDRACAPATPPRTAAQRVSEATEGALRSRSRPRRPMGDGEQDGGGGGGNAAASIAGEALSAFGGACGRDGEQQPLARDAEDGTT